jgi:hypothetical protein
MQLAAPDALRGRVMSVYSTINVGSTPIGGLAMGAIGSSFGIAASLLTGGAVAALAGAVGLVWLRRRGLDAAGPSTRRRDASTGQRITV